MIRLIVPWLAGLVTLACTGELESPTVTLPAEVDADGDGFVASEDCDDTNEAVNPLATEVCANGLDDDCDPKTLDRFDADDDGVSCAIDCDDTNPDVFPGAPEQCGNGLDDDCDTSTPDLFDEDADGSTCDVDCDDSNNEVFPGATEQCANAIDDDCDASTPDIFDADGDGSTCDLDCDDFDQDVFPGAIERCANAIDDDCDPSTNDIFDADGDGSTCNIDCDDTDAAISGTDADNDGFSTCTGDCDDTDAAISPGVPEVCANGIDDDCNAVTVDVFDADGDGATCEIDCDDADASLNLLDTDGDLVTTCSGDCDDTDASVFPGATEQCSNGIDDDCDVLTADVFDADGDGASCDVDCDDTDASLNLDDADGDFITTCAGDCDDTDAGTFPGAGETCANGVDDDCDGSTPDVFDADGDGNACDVDCDDFDADLNLDDRDGDNVPTCAGDCDDLDASVFSGAPELCANGIDDDCDPSTPDIFDADLDGANCDVDCADDDGALNLTDADKDGQTTCAGDCDDANLTLNTLDQDGDGDTSCATDCDDLDAALTGLDLDGDGIDTCSGDCDDLDAATYPGAVDPPCSGVDEACDGQAEQLVGVSFTTVQAAIDASLDGDVVCLPAGTTVETGIRVDVDVEIRGQGETASTLDARANGNALTFEAGSAGVRVQDLTVLGTTSFFTLWIEEDTTIERVTLDGGAMIVIDHLATLNEVSILNTLPSNPSIAQSYAIWVQPNTDAGLQLTDVEILNAEGIIQHRGFGPIDIDGLRATGIGDLQIDFHAGEPTSIRDASFTGVRNVLFWGRDGFLTTFEDVTFTSNTGSISISGSNPTAHLFDMDRFNVIRPSSPNSPIVTFGSDATAHWTNSRVVGGTSNHPSIQNSGSSDVVLENLTVVNSVTVPSTTAEGVQHNSSGTLAIRNCIFASTSPTGLSRSEINVPLNAILEYNLIEGLNSGTNSDAAPLLDSDFCPSPGSPAIDAGDSTVDSALLPDDAYGNPRVVDDPATIDSGVANGANLVVDIGACEIQAP